MRFIFSALAAVALASTAEVVCAQAPVPAGNAVHSPELYGALQYRMVGPYRGGRSSAVTGTSADPATFFMGTTGGGTWKTDDYGVSWTPISDDFFGGEDERERSRRSSFTRCSSFCLCTVASFLIK